MIDNETFYNYSDADRSPAAFDNEIQGMEESLLLPQSQAAPPVFEKPSAVQSPAHMPFLSLTNEELNDMLLEMEVNENAQGMTAVNREIFEDVNVEPIPVQAAPIDNGRQQMRIQEDKRSSFPIPKGVHPLQEKISPFTNLTTLADYPFRHTPATASLQGRIEDGSSSEDESLSKNNYCPKFRGYQCTQWRERYAELYKFYEKHGHSSVPHTDSPYKRLARWVKRQRYQYKLRQEGKPSAMTDDRVKLLENLGFVWDSHGQAWEERLKELEEFKTIHKHCNVPSNYKANSSLASWIKCQRRQYRLYREGKNSNITQARINQLEQMGFQFNPRVGYHHQRLLGRKGWS